MARTRAKPGEWNAASWQSEKDPLPMADWLQSRASERKLRLFAVACCRPLIVLFETPGKRKASEVEDAFRAALAVAERLAEGLGSDAEREAAYRQLAQARNFVRADWMAAALVGVTWAIAGSRDNEYLQRLRRIGYCLRREPPDPWAANAAKVTQWPLRGARPRQVQVVRDIFGNPFRPVTLDPAWRSSTAVSLAEAIYAERAFDRLPILADALEEAGCTSADVLEHCRQPAEHVRGCWVVDLVLAKA